MTDKTKKNCGCSKQETIYNEHYYEQGRNGWTSSYSGLKPNTLITKEISNETSKFEVQLLKVTKNITKLLISKNKAYGNTALNPTNIFSKLNATEAICARLDDKLARISNKGINDQTEDTVDDLIGYLLLLKMAMNDKK
jgi:hypothetical protein